MGLVGKLPAFPAVKEFWKSVKNWQSYCHEFGVQLFWGHSVSVVIKPLSELSICLSVCLFCLSVAKMQKKFFSKT